MKLQIDNLDGVGLRDYTSAIDAAHTPRITRQLNQPAELRFTLLQIGSDFVVPMRGARVLLGRTNGQDVFTGYITASPEFEYLGWGERGVMFRYNFVAQSDEALLDQKTLTSPSPFVNRSAGDALRQLTQDALPGGFDTSKVQDLDPVPSYDPDPQYPWSAHARALCLQARASYRAMSGALTFAPLGEVAYDLPESDPNFSPGNLLLSPASRIVNDATIIGNSEPQDYVRDYFVGDGLTTRFHLSQTPFSSFTRTIFSEEYASSTLDPTRWNVIDPGAVVGLSAGKLQIAGGNHIDGATTVCFGEKLELGGAWVVQHGDVVFNAASTGILGGLYLGPLSATNCLAGFRITPSGATSQVQAIINAAAVGSSLATVAGHHYVLSTRIYSQQIFREQQLFHSATYPAGSGLGGASISADVRLVLEVHDVDPANPATMVAPSTVLYDGIISGAPAFCTYALVNSADLHCQISFTRLLQAADSEVRSALPQQAYRTRLVGPLSQGGECNVYSGATLDFFNQYVPALNETITVSYRGHGRALARVTNPASIAAEQRGSNDGVCGTIRHLKLPPARTSSDCENAALVLLKDGTAPGFNGRYQTWNDFLPGGAQDLFPGDALNVNLPSQSAVFRAIVTEVGITVRDLAGDHSWYEIHFCDECDSTLSFAFDSQKLAASINALAIPSDQVGANTLPDLTASAVTAVTSTTASIDTGVSAPVGGGFEVRWSDAGWGPYNDQNLAGRFTTQTFTLPRLGKTQDYYLRQYDSSSPPRYSRFSSALHVDYPY